MDIRLLGLALGTLSLFVVFSLFTVETRIQNLGRSTAMITNYAGNSGGTGVVVESSRNESKVLTNAHVCGVAKNGGLVQTSSGKGVVSYFQVSDFHDLCLITVENYLGPSATIAKTSPPVFSEASVSGHPQLLPTIITKGHFSDKKIIQVMTGFRACTDDDFKSDTGQLICGLLGGIPVFKTYQAQVISATIMPGSSGSAVYNSSGNVAGLVFAGSGSLSYGFIVPQEYVFNFITTEVFNLEKQFPKDLDLLSQLDNASHQNLEAACTKIKAGDNTLEPIKPFCNYLNNNLLF